MSPSDAVLTSEEGACWKSRSSFSSWGLHKIIEMTGLGGGPSKSDVARGGDGGLHHHHHHHQQQQQPDIRRPAPLQGVDGTQQEAPSKAQPAPWAPATDAHTPAPQIHQHTQEQQQQQQQPCQPASWASLTLWCPLRRLQLHRRVQRRQRVRVRMGACCVWALRWTATLMWSRTRTSRHTPDARGGQPVTSFSKLGTAGLVTHVCMTTLSMRLFHLQRWGCPCGLGNLCAPTT
mmetsp:Transcript_17950/g.50177  ORF Transcript_17950/g.50177 Transcript_17950/m.50177 type:complete len:233 (+) Transcript_17950:3206-3904(+)